MKKNRIWGNLVLSIGFVVSIIFLMKSIWNYYKSTKLLDELIKPISSYSASETRLRAIKPTDRPKEEKERKTEPTIIISRQIGYTGTWGVATQIDEHTWTMKVAEDEKMATAEEILMALNQYRQKHGAQKLIMEEKLKAYANERAAYFDSIEKLDSHEGFNNFLKNENGYEKLGFNWLGENASYGYKLNGTHLIEWIFAGDEPHDKNQLDSKWDHVGIGIKGTGVCLIFATAKR